MYLGRVHVCWRRDICYRLLLTEAYKRHCVLCKDVLCFVFQTFDFQVLFFGVCVLRPVFLVERVAQPHC